MEVVLRWAMHVFAEDFVAYEDMKAYLIDDQDDEFDFESVPRFMADFDARIDRLAESVRFIVPEALVLSNEGCSRCA